MQFTLGADPEFALVDEDNSPVSATNILPPKKQAIELVNGAMLYHDNVMAELNVPIARNIGEWKTVITYSLRELVKAIKPLKIAPVSSAHYSPAQLTHPNTRVFGCKPELDAWDVKNGRPRIHTPPSLADQTSLRACGGHIHIGIPDVSLEVSEVLALVRRMDMTVGLFSELLDNNHAARQRKVLYGKAGRFRITPYGFEYRTPSNAWLRNRPAIGYVYFLASMAVNPDYHFIIPGDVKLALDTGKRELVEDVWRHTCMFDEYEIKNLTHSVFYSPPESYSSIFNDDLNSSPAVAKAELIWKVPDDFFLKPPPSAMLGVELDADSN